MVPGYHGAMVPWYHGAMVPWYHGFQEKTNILAPELLTPNLQLFAMLLVTIWSAMPPPAKFRQVSGAEFQYKSVQRHR